MGARIFHAILFFSETVDEMYRGEFDTESCRIALNIEDTGGSYFQVRPTDCLIDRLTACATDCLSYKRASLHMKMDIGYNVDILTGENLS